MRIFVAGASGLIGVRLVPLLVEAGHEVAGMTRSPDKAGRLRDLGAEPVIGDVFDAEALAEAVAAYGPDCVFHQLTDLPDHVTDMASFGARNDRIRSEGTHNLLAAAVAAGAEQFIAQSIAWEQSDEARRTVTASHERTVLEAGGVVIRYGQFWGPGTYYETTPPARPRIHLDDAARLSVLALEAPPGATLIIDDRALQA
jgi:nucleoside-diphosphate-sugar epimerase